MKTYKNKRGRISPRKSENMFKNLMETRPGVFVKNSLPSIKIYNVSGTPM